MLWLLADSKLFLKNGVTQNSADITFPQNFPDEDLSNFYPSILDKYGRNDEFRKHKKDLAKRLAVLNEDKKSKNLWNVRKELWQ